MSKWKLVTCKKCGFTYTSHPDLFNEKKLDGLCVKCFNEKENKKWKKKKKK